jgi:hypothetical protein
MRYQMPDGTVLDTENARNSWEEAKRWDGNNRISVPTGRQHEHQQLYESRRGRYYLVHSSDYLGAPERAEWVDERRATAWLLLNEHGLPEALQKFAEEVCE